MSEIATFGIPKPGEHFPVENVLEAAREIHFAKVMIIGETLAGQFKYASSTGDRAWLISAVDKFKFEAAKR